MKMKMKFAGNGNGIVGSELHGLSDARMRTHTLKRVAEIPHPRDRVFEFFADARNLEQITPPWLKFRLRERGPIRLAVGTKIEYRLRVHGIPLGWISEITEWNPPHGFVDTQIKGPYREWVHAHRFEETGAGTRMIDEVEYAVPFGEWVHRLLVRRDLERIFDFRTEALREVFPGAVAVPIE